MTTAPFTTTIRPRQTTVLQNSPYQVILLLPRETGVAAPANELTVITSDAVALAQLGDNTKVGRQWYDYLESQANVHIAALPFTPDSTPATEDGNASTALDALLNPLELDKLTIKPDLVLAPNYPGRAVAASPIVSKLETVCADPRVGAIGVVDAFHTPAGATQAQVLQWATANLGADILAISNNAPVDGVDTWGSVIATGHICRLSASEGVGSHPFNLDTPVVGVGVPTPKRAFDLDDGTAAAEVLSDAYVSSIIVYDGTEYLWLGKLDNANDPREWFGNAIIAKRMTKRAKALLAPFLGQRATGLLLEQMSLVVGTTLEAEYGGLVAGISVPTATLQGNRGVVNPEVAFYDYLESIQLIADVRLGT